MMRRTISLACCVLVLSVLVSPACAGVRSQSDAPHIINAKEETRPVGQSLSAAIAQMASDKSAPTWIGYGVDEIAGEQSVCCEHYLASDFIGCGTCNLENSREGFSTRDHNTIGTVVLEGEGKLAVLLRISDGKVMRIRVASVDCTVDAGGLRLVWLTGVKPEESVAVLSNYVHAQDFQDQRDHGMSQQALAAIALHAYGSADRAFEGFVAADQPWELRKQAVFWLGAARGKSGLTLLQRIAKSDPTADVRAQVAFAFFVSREPGAIEEMIRMAHEDESSHVRGQALFWLAQKAGNKASRAITGAIENDPDTEVKKKAVFALSQMPKDEGIPKLIEVAQTNRNREVRKQAMFWLGQSNDPRALAFFEKVLAQ